MMCDGCAEKIRGALSVIPGVREVQTKLWRKRIRVRYDSSMLERQRIKDVLGSAGFPASEV
jgi:copper chaperone CopZ